MYNFGEKEKEFDSKSGKELIVWQSPKYKVAKEKAIEMIESKKYDLTVADFWILMNTTKSGKMMYSGLIISHNGCLKINDKLDNKFNPSCVTVDKDAYNDSLVCFYCNEEQGLFECGEVSKTNCKNEYPYAMAIKRCFDRVVLKLSKLAYSGIYSDSESDEFVKPDIEKTEDEIQITTENENSFVCEKCGTVITEKIKSYSQKTYRKSLCMKCQNIEKLNKIIEE